MADFQLQSPYDNRVYSLSDQKEADNLVNMGYTQATPEQVRHEELLKGFDNWKGKAIAAGTAFMDSLPGVNALVAKFDDPANVKFRLEQGALAREENPGYGTAGTLAGLGAQLTVAAPVSAALAGAAATGAAAAGAGTVGTYAAVAGASGLEAVGFGAAARLDNAAIQHSLDPEGAEKLAAEGGSGWRDFALGVAAHTAIGGVAKAFGKLGDAAGKFANSQFRRSLTDNDLVQKVMSVAQQDSMWQTAKAMGVVGLKNEHAKELVGRRIQQVTADMNAVKKATKGSVLDGPARQQAMEAMAQALEGTPLAGKVKSWYAKDLGVQQLQNIRQEIYRGVKWSNVTEGHGPAYKDAGLYVGQQIRTVLASADQIPGQVRAQQWAALDREYSDLRLLHDNIKAKGKSADGFKWMEGVVGWGAMGTAAKFAMGPQAAGVVAAVGATKKLVQAFKEGAFGNASRKLGNVFDAFAEKSASAAEAGLYGIPQAVHGAIDHENEYEKHAAQVAAIRNSPDKAFEQMQTAATSAGIPDDVAQGIVERKHAQLQYLGQQLPGRIGASELPTRAMPDPAAQRKWLGKLYTSENPAYGFANPTAANMDILKRFYPQTLAQMQQTVHAHLQKNPDAPAEARVWASRILGRPVTAMASPAYFSLMAKLRDQEEQQNQAGPSAKRRQGGTAVASSVQSGAAPTRLEQLSGG